MNETPDRQGIPAQRVIAKDGKLSGGWAFGGEAAMRGLLEGEGVTFDDQGRARMKVHEWDPTRDLVRRRARPHPRRSRLGDGATLRRPPPSAQPRPGLPLQCRRDARLSDRRDGLHGIA